MFLNLCGLEIFFLLQVSTFKVFIYLRHLKVMYNDKQIFFILQFVIPKEETTLNGFT